MQLDPNHGFIKISRQTWCNVGCLPICRLLRAIARSQLPCRLLLRLLRLLRLLGDCLMLAAMLSLLGQVGRSRERSYNA